mgnify:CR=1 FL=1
MLLPGRPLIAVNVSPVQLALGGLPDLVEEVLRETGLAPERLELEITEGVLIEDFDRGLALLRRLKALGVRISMDDFGSGYSSLSYLQAFPFDKIKIDRTFITDIDEPTGSADIVKAVVDIAAERDMTTTAEGVETTAQRDMLRQLGCSEMQGYLFSRPVPAVRMRQLLNASHGRRVPDEPLQMPSRSIA